MEWISVRDLDLKALAKKFESYNWIEVLLIMKNPKKKSETVMRMDRLYRDKYDSSFKYDVEKVQNGDCLLEKADNGEEFYWSLSHAAFKNVYAIADADDIIDEVMNLLKKENNGKGT